MKSEYEVIRNNFRNVILCHDKVRLIRLLEYSHGKVLLPKFSSQAPQTNSARATQLRRLYSWIEVQGLMTAAIPAGRLAHNIIGRFNRFHSAFTL